MRFLPLLLVATSLSGSAAPNPAVSATNAGGLKIFAAAAASTDGNLCLSPFSIQSALAMTYAGASGTTRAQMAAALGFPDNPVTLAEGFGVLNAGLEKSAAAAGPEMSMLVANRLFGAKGFAFRQKFLDLCSSAFGAPLETLAFQDDPASATARINAWVERQTADRIRDLIPANAITRDTTLVLVNALYLKTPWDEAFQQAPELDFLKDGERRGVPAISRTGRLGYGQSGGFTLVSVPFRGGQFQFLILLPDRAGPLPPVSQDLLEKGASLPAAEVFLTMPKFRLEPPTLALGDILKSLGMKEAFDIPEGSADFDAIAPRRPDDYLFISDVFHKTFFALDENGVEAAAATAVIMMRALAMPVGPPPVTVRADRPFYFAVQHVPTGTCLFLGRLIEPR